MSYLEYVTNDRDQENPVEDLARVNGFTLQDLEQNRQGRISELQVARLYMRALQPVKYPAMALAGWLFFCWVVDTVVPGIVLMIITMISGKALAAVFGITTLLCLGALGLAVMKSTRRIALLLQDVSARKATYLEGRVSPSHEESGGLGLDRLYGEKRKHCWYVVRDEYFDVDEGAAAALDSGKRYRLYHTPKSKLMLSIEPAPNN